MVKARNRERIPSCHPLIADTAIRCKPKLSESASSFRYGVITPWLSAWRISCDESGRPPVLIRLNILNLTSSGFPSRSDIHGDLRLLNATLVVPRKVVVLAIMELG